MTDPVPLNIPPGIPADVPLTRARTIAAFASTTVLSGAVSVLSIPLIVVFADAHVWASIALGQAVGSSISVLAMFGWGITGPAAIAMMKPDGHAAAYWNSIVARGLLFIPGAIVIAVITGLIVPSDQFASIVCAIAMGSGGLSGSWFTVGRKRPDKLFLLDTLPRIGGTITGIVALALSHSVVWFGVCQLLGSLLAFVLITRWAIPGLRRPAGAARTFRQISHVIADQRHGVAMAVAIASYYPAVLAIVAGFAPRYLPLYALNEKVLRFALMAMQPIFQYFQATVPTHRGLELGRSIRRSLFIVVGLSAVCWIGYTVLLPVASTLLTHGQVTVPLLVGITLGAYMGSSVLINHMSTVVLIAVDRVRTIGRGAIISSAVGLLAILLLAMQRDGEWISWGFVVTNVLILGYEFVVLARALPAKLAERDFVVEPGTVAG